VPKIPFMTDFSSEISSTFDTSYCEKISMILSTNISSEFSSVNFNDKRLNKRIKIIAEKLYKNSNASTSSAMGKWSFAKAAYNFYDNSNVSPEKIIQSHANKTTERISLIPSNLQHNVILSINDTTAFDYSSCPSIKGLGPISDKENSYGFFLHPTLITLPEGIPLGIINTSFWARKQEKKSKNHHQETIDQKESFKWIESYNETLKIQQKLQEYQFIHIGDRESDIFDLFFHATSIQSNIKPDLLIRAAYDRKVEDENAHLWAVLKNKKISDLISVDIPRNQNQKERTALISIRFSSVIIKPPKNHPNKKNLQPIKLYAVFANEESTPDGIKPISWMLLTTIPIHNFQQAVQMIKYYTARWTIEIFFKVLKSGCNAEDHQVETKERLFNAVSINCVVAWRILFLTLIGRYAGNLPASAIFEEYEWKALYAFMHNTKKIPDNEPSLKDTTLLIAKLGGFLARKHDGFPGPNVMWHGLFKLSCISEAYLLFNST
jgi:hypothetical protein